MILNARFCCQMVACIPCKNKEFSSPIKVSMKSIHLFCNPNKVPTDTDTSRWRQQIKKLSICEKKKIYYGECLCIGRNSSGSSRGSDFSGEGGGEPNNNDYRNSMDAYYQKMLKKNPRDSILLTNYARFLHEVIGDITKAEEYYERGIMASPDNGYLLCLYASFIWEAQNDPRRAQAYFEQSVEAAPNDCYVLASYAIFLWNSEVGDDDYNDYDNLV